MIWEWISIYYFIEIQIVWIYINSILIISLGKKRKKQLVNAIIIITDKDKIKIIHLLKKKLKKTQLILTFFYKFLILYIFYQQRINRIKKKNLGECFHSYSKKTSINHFTKYYNSTAP